MPDMSTPPNRLATKEDMGPAIIPRGKRLEPDVKVGEVTPIIRPLHLHPLHPRRPGTLMQQLNQPLQSVARTFSPYLHCPTIRQIADVSAEIHDASMASDEVAEVHALNPAAH
jgi:hypothetical protein